MRPGDRVHTNAGPGTITRIHTTTEWVFGQPRHTVWVWVVLDRTGRSRQFISDEITEEVPVNENPDTTTEVDPTQPAPTPEPTEPESEPTEEEPNNDDEDEDTKATRVIITEDEVELVEWP